MRMVINTYLRDSKGKYRNELYVLFKKSNVKYDSTMKLYVPKKKNLKETKTKALHL